MRLGWFSRIAAVLCVLGGFPSASAESSGDLLADFEARLRIAIPEARVIAAADSAVSGYYWVKLDDGTLLHVPPDGQNFFVGSLYGFSEDGVVNLTDTEIMAPVRLELLGKVESRDMITFKARKSVPAPRWVAVFTDVDCGYCRKFHQQVSELNDAGVEVRYLAFPRSGVDSTGYRKLVTAWCSADPKKALTRLKDGRSLPEKRCENPVSGQYELGLELGIRGTPALFFDNGRMTPGLVSVNGILEILEEE